MKCSGYIMKTKKNYYAFVWETKCGYFLITTCAVVADFTPLRSAAGVHSA